MGVDIREFKTKRVSATTADGNVSMHLEWSTDGPRLSMIVRTRVMGGNGVSEKVLIPGELVAVLAEMAPAMLKDWEGLPDDRDF